jgi:hypothetical protein
MPWGASERKLGKSLKPNGELSKRESITIKIRENQWGSGGFSGLTGNRLLMGVDNGIRKCAPGMDMFSNIISRMHMELVLAWA